VISTLVVDGWTATFGTARRGLGGPRSRAVPSSVLTVPNVTAYASTASVVYQLHIIRCGTI